MVEIPERFAYAWGGLQLRSAGRDRSSLFDSISYLKKSRKARLQAAMTELSFLPYSFTLSQSISQCSCFPAFSPVRGFLWHAPRQFGNGQFLFPPSLPPSIPTTSIVRKDVHSGAGNAGRRGISLTRSSVPSRNPTLLARIFLASYRPRPVFSNLYQALAKLPFYSQCFFLPSPRNCK